LKAVVLSFARTQIGAQSGAKSKPNEDVEYHPEILVI
jgi:hypothetical protein